MNIGSALDHIKKERKLSPRFANSLSAFVSRSHEAIAVAVDRDHAYEGTGRRGHACSSSGLQRPLL
jgi:hypothetical protein